MAKEKKIINIVEEEGNEKYGKDSAGRIVKLEDKGDSEKRAKTKRILAVIMWIIAIAFEVVGILRLTGKINLLPNIELVTFLIGCIVLDLIFFVPASLLWKKANHIDPASEKDKTKFWIHNNLGSLLSVLAFLPIIIVVLTNKDLDKKSKTLVTVVAAAALVIAGVTGYDFNPISSEQLAQAEKEVQAVSADGYVYWAPTSKKYHVDPDCPSFSQSEEIFQGTVKQAFEKGLTDPCRRCILQIEE